MLLRRRKYERDEEFTRSEHVLSRSGAELTHGNSALAIRARDVTDSSLDDHRRDGIGRGRGVAQVAAEARSPLNLPATDDIRGIRDTRIGLDEARVSVDAMTGDSGAEA